MTLFLKTCQTLGFLLISNRLHCLLQMRCCFLFSEALDSILNFSSPSTNSKNIFICWRLQESCGLPVWRQLEKLFCLTEPETIAQFFSLFQIFYSTLTVS